MLFLISADCENDVKETKMIEIAMKMGIKKFGLLILKGLFMSVFIIHRILPSELTFRFPVKSTIKSRA